MLQQVPMRNLKFGTDERSQNSDLAPNWKLVFFFCVSGQNPTEIRKAIEVPQNLRIKIFFPDAERRDMPLRAAACRACKIKSRRNRSSAGDHPVLRIKRFVLLEIGNDRRDPIHHLRCGNVKAILDVTFPIAWRRRQFTHDNDQIFLRGENFV